MATKYKISSFILNKCYSFADIQDYTEGYDEIDEYGKQLIGELFLVIKNNKDQTVSFVLNGYNDNHGYSMKCIYTDFK